MEELLATQPQQMNRLHQTLDLHYQLTMSLYDAYATLVELCVLVAF